MIGHASQAPNPGDYFTGSVADINYVVVRGDDGQLRAFHNVSHRVYLDASTAIANRLDLLEGLYSEGTKKDSHYACSGHLTF